MITFRKAYILLTASFFFLLATRGAFFPEDYYLADEANSSDANIFFLIFWPMYLALYLAMYWRRTVERARTPLSLMLVIAAVVASVVFSELPDVSIRRASALFISLACGLLLVKTAKEPQEIVQALYSGLAPLVLISVAGALLFPSHAIHYASPDLVGDWKGVFSHKNTTAYVAAVVLVISAHQVKIRGFALYPTAIFLSSLILIIKANSLFIIMMTPLCFVTAALLGQRTRASKLYARAVAVSAALILIPIALLTFYNPRWPEFLGTTLNNRTEIWSTLLSAQAGHELFGHGYGAVHNVGENSVFWRYGEWRIQTLGHGHSGQLDVYAATGILGWIAVNIFLFSTLVRIDLKSQGSSRHQGIVFAFLAWIVITRSFVESDLLETGRIDWFLCSIAIIALHRWYHTAPNYSSGPAPNNNE